MSVTSGPTSGKQFAFYDPDTSSWRTWPDISLWGSTPYSERWPRTGSMRGGRAYEHPTSARPIIGTGCSSSPHLPTPTASDWKRDDHESEQHRKSPSITTTRAHWPLLADGNNWLPTEL